MLRLSSASTKGAEHDWSEGAIFNFNNPLVVLPFLLPLVGVNALLRVWR
jgi:hypothetical protein